MAYLGSNNTSRALLYRVISSGSPPFVGMVLNSQKLVSTLHLLFCQSACQGQSKALPRLDGIDMRITAHRALFTAMVGFAWLAFGPLLTG